MVDRPELPMAPAALLLLLSAAAPVAVPFILTMLFVLFLYVGFDPARCAALFSLVRYSNLVAIAIMLDN